MAVEFKVHSPVSGEWQQEWNHLCPCCRVANLLIPSSDRSWSCAAAGGQGEVCQIHMWREGQLSSVALNSVDVREHNLVPMPTPFLGSHVIRLFQYTDSDRQHRLKNNRRYWNWNKTAFCYSIAVQIFHTILHVYELSDEELGWSLGLGLERHAADKRLYYWCEHLYLLASFPDPTVLQATESWASKGVGKGGAETPQMYYMYKQLPQKGVQNWEEKEAFRL